MQQANDELKTYDFRTADDGRIGGTKYRVIGKDVIFRQDFSKGGFGPGTRNIKITNGDGRWIEMEFTACRCPYLCHYPGKTSDDFVKITRRTWSGSVPSSEFEYTIEFQPIIKTGTITTRLFETMDDQGRKGGTKYRVTGQDATFTQDLRPGTGDITIRNGDGRTVTMEFVPCKCAMLCHHPLKSPYNGVKIDVTPWAADHKVAVEFLPMAETRVFLTADYRLRRGGVKYQVTGVGVHFEQSPETGDIVIRDIDGRWARMEFDACRCPLLCHVPGGTSDDRVEIEEFMRTRSTDPLPEFPFVIKFLPLGPKSVEK